MNQQKTINQKQPNNASCFLTAFACVVGEPVESLMKLLGHDGTAMINCNGVMKRRGFHYEEIARLLLLQGYAVTPLHCRIDLADFEHRNQGSPYTIHYSDLHDLMIGRSGVITDVSTHACAWDGGVVYDPGLDRSYDLETFERYYGGVYCFYLIHDLHELI